MFLWIEYSWFTVNANTTIRRLPLAINKCHPYATFTLMALELNTLDQYFDTAHPQDSAP